MGDEVPSAEDCDNGIHLTVDSFDSTSGNVVHSDHNTRHVISEGVEEPAVVGAPKKNTPNYTPSTNTNSYSDFDSSVAGKDVKSVGAGDDGYSQDEESGRWSKNNYAEEMLSKNPSTNTKAKDSTNCKTWGVASDQSIRMTAKGQGHDGGVLQNVGENKRQNIFLKQHSYMGEDAIQGLNAVQGTVKQSPIASELNSLPLQPSAVRNGDAWAPKPSALASKFQWQSYFTPIGNTNTTIMRDNNSGQRAASRDRQSPLILSTQNSTTSKAVGAGTSSAFQFFRASSNVTRVTEDGTVTDFSTENQPATTTTTTAVVTSVANVPKKTTTNYDATTGVVPTGSPLRARSTAAAASGRLGNHSVTSSGVIDGYDPYDDVYRGDGSRTASNTRISAQGSYVGSNANTEVFTDVVPLRSQPSVIQTDNERFVVCVDTPTAIQVNEVTHVQQPHVYQPHVYQPHVYQPHVSTAGDVLRSTFTTYEAPSAVRNVVPMQTSSTHHNKQKPPQKPGQPRHTGITTSTSVARNTSQQRTHSNHSRSSAARAGGQLHEYRCRDDLSKSLGFAHEMASCYDVADSFKELLAEIAHTADEVVLIKHPPNSRYQSYSGIPTDLAEKGHVLSFSTVDSQGEKQQDGESGFEAVVLWPKSDGVDTINGGPNSCGTTTVQRLREVGPTVSLKVTRSAKNPRAKSGPPVNRF